MRRSYEVFAAHPGLEPDLDEVCGDKEGRRGVVVVVVCRGCDGDEGDECNERGSQELLHLRVFYFYIFQYQR